MTITLPLPSRKLSPNARVHWRVRSKVTKSHRAKAEAEVIVAANEQGGVACRMMFNAYRLTFYWPDKRLRDDDNAASSCKAYRDGIADALGVDDRTLRFHGPPEMLHDKLNPRLEVELFLTQPA